MRKSEHDTSRATTNRTTTGRATAANRATARVAPTIHGHGEPTHPCIVGAGLAPALLFALASLLALAFSLFPFAASAYAAAGTGRIYAHQAQAWKSSTAPAHAAAGTGRIYGQLLDGTKHNAPVAGQSVTLQMAQGDNTRDLVNVTTDAHGEFSFSGLDTDKTINYAVYTLYQGAQYYTDLIDLSSKSVQQINLTVYDATTSTANIAIVQATILVDKVDAQNGLITISENYFFENLGSTSYVGSLQANGSKPNALRFSLPTGARKLLLSSGFNGYQDIQVDTGFATNAALPPGTSQLAFSFQVPYTATGYDFSYTVVYPTVALSLLAPLDIHANSSGMDSQGPVNVNQHTYQQLKSQKLLAGNQIHVQLEGLPAPQNAASPAPLNQSTLWIIVAIILMLAIVGVTWFVSRLSRRRATATRKQATRGKGGVSARQVAKKQASEARDRQEVLLQELLDLDTAYEAGKIKKAEYAERRAKTKALLRSIMNSEPVEKTAKGYRERAIPGDQRTKKEF